MEHGVLEKEHVPRFIQQISEVISLVNDHPQAALATATEGQSARPSLVTKSSEADGDEMSSVAVGTTASSINISPPRCLSPSNIQKEGKPGVNSEVDEGLCLAASQWDDFDKQINRSIVAGCSCLIL